ncbi:MAG: response regulator [Sneathiellales bacterium]|nr:response regulator [Sneathiellales bacterium]
MTNQRGLSLVVLIFLAVMLFFLERQIEKINTENEVNRQRDQVLHDAQDLRVKLTSQITEGIYILSGLRAYIEANPDITNQEFERYADSVRRLEPAIRSIAVAPDMVVRFVYPLEGNEASLGLDYRHAPIEQRAAAFRTLRAGRPVVAGPVNLVQGGKALIVRLPVYVRQEDGSMKEWGILAAPIDLDEFYKLSGIREFQKEYSLGLRGVDGLGYRGDVFLGNASLFTEALNSVQIPIEFSDGEWILALVPKNGWVSQPGNVWTVRVLFIAGFLVFSVIWLTAISYFDQRKEVRRRHQQALREKSEFLEILSHEIRSPLQGVLGVQRYLLDHGIEGSLRQIVETAHQSGDYINSLINDYLDLQRAESGSLIIHRSPCNIRNIIEHSFKIVTTGLKSSSLAVNFTIPETIPSSLMLDEKKVHQVLVNVIGNALKYTSRGFVSVVVNYSTTGDVPYLIIKVEDTGIGIEKKDLATLFDRFTRSVRGEARTGSGLGLAIAKSLVEAMSGSIDVESEVGKGTAFIISIPTSEQGDLQIDESGELIVSQASSCDDIKEQMKNHRVLVADDVVVNRLLLSAMLSPLVKEVVLAEDGQQALDALEKSRFDLVIMDIQMPHMTGVEVARHLRQDPVTADIPIIALTGEDSQNALEELSGAGMNAVLVKPIALEPLLEVIKEQFPTNVI